MSSPYVSQVKQEGIREYHLPIPFISPWHPPLASFLFCPKQTAQSSRLLDFSSEPAVVFDKPGKDKTTFMRGDKIKFAAVLVDPKLDIMIRRLYDMSVKVDKEYKDKDGKVIHTAKVNKSLDPNVIITRADGRIVAEGVMPFG
jgi:hypothetical protein